MQFATTYPLQVMYVRPIGLRTAKAMERATGPVDQAMGRKHDGYGTHLLNDVEVISLSYRFDSEGDREAGLNRFLRSAESTKRMFRIDFKEFDPFFKRDQIVADLTPKFTPKVVR